MIKRVKNSFADLAYTLTNMQIDEKSVGIALLSGSIENNIANADLYNKAIKAFTSYEAGRIQSALIRLLKPDDSDSPLVSDLMNTIENYLDQYEYHIRRKGRKNQINTVNDFMEHYIFASKGIGELFSETGTIFMQQMQKEIMDPYKASKMGNKIIYTEHSYLIRCLKNSLARNKLF